jgi:hypothetical protein
VSTPAEPVVRPPGPVQGSFWVLIVSAAVRVIFAVITVATWTAFTNAQLRGPLPPHTTVVQARSAIHTYLLVNIVLDALFAAAYVLLAYQIRAGRNWARLTITTIVVLFGLFDIFTGANGTTLAIVVVELVGVALLWLPQSRAFFAPDRTLA